MTFLEGTFSATGRKTQGHLDFVRRTVDPGTDPAFDNSHHARQQHKREHSLASAPTLGDLVCGSEPAEWHGFAEVPPAPARQRPSSAFLAQGRRKGMGLRQDASPDARAPLMGPYPADKTPCQPRLPRGLVPFGKPRVDDASSNLLESTVAGGTGLAVSKSDAGMTRTTKTTTEEEVFVEAPVADYPFAFGREPHVNCFHMSKVSARPDLMKQMGISCNENSFTQGIPDGDLQCSQSSRQPCWEFSKARRPTAEVARRYAEPGLYNIKDAVVRPRSSAPAQKFEKQVSRRPLSAPGAGHWSSTACQGAITTAEGVLPAKDGRRTVNERHISVPDFAKSPQRPLALRDEASPTTLCVAAANAQTDLADLGKIQTALRPRPTSAPCFGKTIGREQQQKAQRAYGGNVHIEQRRHNLEEAGRTAGQAEADCGGEGRIALQQPVGCPSFARAPGRRCDRQHAEPSARQRASRSAGGRFSRGRRPGEGRCQVGSLSDLTSAIAELRTLRTYEALAHQEAVEGAD